MPKMMPWDSESADARLVVAFRVSARLKQSEGTDERQTALTRSAVYKRINSRPVVVEGTQSMPPFFPRECFAEIPADLV